MAIVVIHNLDPSQRTMADAHHGDISGFRRQKFINDFIAHKRTRESIHTPLEQRVSLDVLEADAIIAWDRLQAERGEHLEASRWYQQVARDDLRKLKKRLGERKRMTITVPVRIIERLSHVPTGLRSACVTRLIARGWLWSEAYGSEEVE